MFINENIFYLSALNLMHKE